MTQSSTPLRPKILYVEDEVIVALDVSDGLENDLGFDVQVAHNLTTARAKCAAHEFDYALLDLNLGNGERSIDLGLELAEKGIKVVFASGYNRDEIAEISEFQLVEKPFQIADIAAAFGVEPAKA
ncbi:response regulator [Loktanella sp. SALINAS62]|uniref:response regulator n=1 Tax=Loktanella sp. SALINAS62 TaxID=2706124 RepID=UPI001B8B9A4F|nr:response regulator [Loktanella sp. SALINAS62]MBS1302308.1 response regulator [Loktanella sp. SALINAS62]